MQLGDYNPGYEGWLSVGDTFELVGTLLMDAYEIEGRDGAGFKGVIATIVKGYPNYIQDPVFINCTADSINTRSKWNTVKILQTRTLRIRVLGSNALPVSDAVVIVWANANYDDSTNNSKARFCDTTGTGGYVQDTMLYKWTQWTNSETGARADSNYNNFRIRVKNAAGTDSTWANTSFLSTTSTAGGMITYDVILDNTLGTGSWKQTMFVKIRK